MIDSVAMTFPQDALSGNQIQEIMDIGMTISSIPKNTLLDISPNIPILAVVIATSPSRC